MSAAAVHKAFRARVRKGETVVGTFVKSASYQLVEVLADSGLDFVVFDAEHAPFDRNALDVCLMATRAGALPALVRIPNVELDTIGAVLDMGAAGILVPHVTDREKAEQVVAATHYRGGRRGFSGSPRASGYGAVPMPEMIANAEDSITVLCQIEDRDGVDNVEAIARVDGVDCLFIGRADLAVANNVAALDDPSVAADVETVLTTAQRVDQRAGIFLAAAAAAADYRGRGVSLFVIGSEQSMLRAAAARLLPDVTKAIA